MSGSEVYNLSSKRIEDHQPFLQELDHVVITRAGDFALVSYERMVSSSYHPREFS
jgi:hypothetical protein